MATDAPKKRKQAPTDSSTPKTKHKKSKSVSFASNDSSKPQRPISLVFSGQAEGDDNENGTSEIVLARTPGIEPPSSLSFSAYARVGRKRQRLMLHSGAHPRLNFYATPIPRRVPHGKEKNYIGIYDPETNELQLALAPVVVLKSSLKTSARPGRTDQSEAANAEDEKEKKSYHERRVALGEEFGTKKAKKALRSEALNAVTGPRRGGEGEQPLPLTAMTEAVILHAKDTGDLEEPTSKEELKNLVEGAHPRPTPNPNAERPADIYNLDSLIPPADLRAVDVVVWNNALDSGSSIKTSSRFVSHRVVEVWNEKDSRKLKALKYLYGMILWLNALEGRGKGSKVLPAREKMNEVMVGIDYATRDSIRKRFASGGPRLSPWDINKAVLHACALAIVLDDCSTEMSDLQEDLKLTGKEIRSYYKELGCVVDASKDDKEEQVAKLRFPFSLPEIRVRRMARR